MINAILGFEGGSRGHGGNDRLLSWKVLLVPLLRKELWFMWIN